MMFSVAYFYLLIYVQTYKRDILYIMLISGFYFVTVLIYRHMRKNVVVRKLKFKIWQYVIFFHANWLVLFIFDFIKYKYCVKISAIKFIRPISSVYMVYSLNVNEWKFHSPIEWNSCKPLKKEWFCTLNSKFSLIKSENHSKKSELPLIWGVKRRTTRKRIVLRLTPQTSGNSLFLESFSLYMSGNLLFNVQNHSFLSGLQEFHSFGEWNFHSFTFREYCLHG